MNKAKNVRHMSLMCAGRRMYFLLHVIVVVFFCMISMISQSSFVSSAPFTANSTIILEECGVVSNPVIFDASSCSVLQSSFETSCINTPVVAVDADITLSLQYNFIDAGTYACEVAVSELGSNNVMGVSFKGSPLRLAETRSTDRNVCIEQTTIYSGSVLLSNSLDVSGFGRNIFDIQLRAGANISKVTITCQEGGDTRSLDTDFLFDQVSYSVGSIVKMKPVLMGGGISPSVSNLSAGTMYRIMFKNSVGKVEFMSYPDSCGQSFFITDHIFNCTVSSNYDPFVFRVKQDGTLAVSDAIEYVSAETGAKIVTQLHTETISISPAEVRGSASNVLLRTTESSKKAISDIRFGDTLTLAEVSCPVSTSNVRFIIHNVNTNVTCPYVSNDNRGGTFYVSLEHRNMQPSGIDCGYPFTITRSGLYTFEAICGETNVCSGGCFNPLPRSVSSLVTVSDWQRYMLIGKTFLSHYNDNSVPDCVCDASSILRPISLLSNNQGLSVQSWGEFQ